MQKEPEKIPCPRCLGTGIAPVLKTLGMPRIQPKSICQMCRKEGKILNIRN